MGKKVNNQMLDAIGRKLVRSEAGRVPQIDKIVADPHLFARVKARIAEEADPKAISSVSLSWSSLFSPQSLAIAGIASILVLAVGALSLLNTGRGVVAVIEPQDSPTKADVARPVIPPQGIPESKLSAGRALKNEFRAEKAVATKMAPRNSIPRVTMDADGEFYPVSYTGDPSETASGGHILRVDMKRSSLFALGIPLPLENGEETVKADLLVGSDGVTRGVRIVK